MVSSARPPANGSAAGKNPRRTSAASAKRAGTLVVVTLKAGDGSIVKIEGLDVSGERHELSAEEAFRLLGDRPKATVEGLVQEAFEAGIACVLDEKLARASPDDAVGESDEDAALHDELLNALIDRSPAKRLLQRDVLNSALLGTLIRVAPRSETRPAE